MKRKIPITCILAAAGAFWMLICAGSYVFIGSTPANAGLQDSLPKVPFSVSHRVLNWAQYTNFTFSRQLGEVRSTDDPRFSAMLTDESITLSNLLPSQAVSLGTSNSCDAVIENELFCRAQLLRKLQARTDKFQESALSGGITEAEARRIVQFGWSLATQGHVFSETAAAAPLESKEQLSADPETEFLLQALAQLEPGECVERARAFALNDCALSKTRKPLSMADQFRLAAVGKSADVSQWTVSFRETRILSRWKMVSAQICAWRAARHSERVPVPSSAFPCLTVSASAGHTTGARKVLEISMQTPDPLDGLCFFQQDKMPKMTIFRLTASLPAGRKPVLLI
ncbi:MAG: hypothetical protein E7029_06920 [Planctomycetaceae bacterium]|nr:hypothetical protein [Planctomycetaceae bacterium]